MYSFTPASPNEDIAKLGRVLSPEKFYCTIIPFKIQNSCLNIYKTDNIILNVVSMVSNQEKRSRSKIAINPHFLSIEERKNTFKEVNLGYANIQEVIEECQRCHEIVFPRD